MIVLPIFADQPDNAQRIQDKGFGIRLNPYEMKEEDLVEAVKRLLEDEEMMKRLEAAKERIEKDQSKVKACERLEKIVADFKGK